MLVGDTALVDLDGDGDLDALAPASTAASSAISLLFENTGGASAPRFAHRGNPFGFGDFDIYAGYAYASQGASSALGDIDGDGDLDAFVEASVFGKIFLENTGTASAPAFAPIPAETLDLTGNDPTLADLDADGDVDALIGVGSGDTLFFENTTEGSEPSFAAPSRTPSASPASARTPRPTSPTSTVTATSMPSSATAPDPAWSS